MYDRSQLGFLLLFQLISVFFYKWKLIKPYNIFITLTTISAGHIYIWFVK